MRSAFDYNQSSHSLTKQVYFQVFNPREHVKDSIKSLFHIQTLLSCLVFRVYSIGTPVFTELNKQEEEEEEVPSSNSLAHMEMAEASLFESSELVGSLLASTPLLSNSWRLCSAATTITPCGFVSETIGDVGYFVFSGCCIQMMTTQQESEYYSTCRNLVPLDDGDGLFSALTKRDNRSVIGNKGDEEEDVVMVHAGLLNLFMSLRSSKHFQDQMLALINESKSIVITGHSIGGTTASLCALWLLCYLESISSSLSVLCITFGSPLLGNESLSQAILRERWGGNFCHVVAQYDIMPRLLYAPLESCTRQLHFMLQYWYMSMMTTSPSNFGGLPVLQLDEEEKAELFRFISHYNLQVSSIAEEKAREKKANIIYWPFGSYLFCSQEGAVCVENAASVIKMMYLMFKAGNPSCCIDDHLKYGDYIRKMSSQFLNKRSFPQEEVFPESSYEAGVALALQSSGLSSQESTSRVAAEDCLKMAKGMERTRTPSQNMANLAISLSQVTPYRAQLEWYKASCDKSHEQLSYYDFFKQRGSSKRDQKVNMNRILLARFWDGVLSMLENNELPHDFPKQGKWVKASQFYKLLVEPLDIAEYYRTGIHRVKGHYLKHGRERRFEVFDRWWRQREVTKDENIKTRNKYASLTQDSCFWAKLEEAREWLANVRSESDVTKLPLLWQNIDNFERYANRLVYRKEVYANVLAKHSSYTLWVEELREVKSQMQ